MELPIVDPAGLTAGFVAFDGEGVTVPALIASGDWNGAARALVRVSSFRELLDGVELAMVEDVDEVRWMDEREGVARSLPLCRVGWYTYVDARESGLMLVEKAGDCPECDGEGEVEVLRGGGRYTVQVECGRCNGTGVD